MISGRNSTPQGDKVSEQVMECYGCLSTESPEGGFDLARGPPGLCWQISLCRWAEQCIPERRSKGHHRSLRRNSPCGNVSRYRSCEHSTSVPRPIAAERLLSFHSQCRGDIALQHHLKYSYRQLAKVGRLGADSARQPHALRVPAQAHGTLPGRCLVDLQQ